MINFRKLQKDIEEVDRLIDFGDYSLALEKCHQLKEVSNKFDDYSKFGTGLKSMLRCK